MLDSADNLKEIAAKTCTFIEIGVMAQTLKKDLFQDGSV